jgi:hypothetical protein
MIPYLWLVTLYVAIMRLPILILSAERKLISMRGALDE